jgi:hypothetical protein
MMQTSIVEPGAHAHARNLANENRHRQTELFSLVEIDRASVVDSVRDGDGHEVEGVYAMGAMREVCPACRGDRLKLVLRQKRVRHAHLFCVSCSKSFDARYSDGSSALELDY